MHRIFFGIGSILEWAARGSGTECPSPCKKEPTIALDENITLDLPTPAMKALQALESAGFEAWLVGGCVRDALLGRPVSDFDITTDAAWERVEQVMLDGGYAVHRTGEKHGTVTVSIDGMAFEITTYRTEAGYSDGRHPDDVRFVSSIEEDLARRDFTINAMAYHPARGVLDLYGGLADLEAGVIRTVGEPAKRFSEDGLRILRGLRFASTLGFSIDGCTYQAMVAHKMMLQKVSVERIMHELDRLLLGDGVFDALMLSIDVIGAVMPEVVACKGFEQLTPYHVYDVWEHIARAVSYAQPKRLNRWSAFFHDVGKPGAFFVEDGRGHFYGHARLSCIIAREIMERLKFSPSFAAKVLKLVRVHDRQIEATPRSVKRALTSLDGDTELFSALLDLKRADSSAQSDLAQPRLELVDRIEAIFEQVIEQEEAFSIKQLAIDGSDILGLGIESGPMVGELLDYALEAVVDETLPNEKEALLTYIENRLANE